MNELIYEGKAKKIFKIAGDDKRVLVHFKDSLTAFNAQKMGSFENKGSINRDIASLIFKFLSAKGVKSHWIEDVGTNDMIVRKLSIIPIEVVIRNILAGSTAKKFAIPEGKVLDRPIVEFYFKNDELQDPFINDDHVLMMGLAGLDEINEIKIKALDINKFLKELFAKTNIDLVDFKIEFGVDANGNIFLADEISPDCCRLWDKQTREKYDKDRFRRDLGSIKESYELVLNKLKGLNL